jgi:hypothetical protein
MRHDLSGYPEGLQRIGPASTEVGNDQYFDNFIFSSKKKIKKNKKRDRCAKRTYW